ncbi:PAS domain-containing sensor histidine kinase [Mucilaginibacter sp. UYCu711]|uniref:PAS domain-containing sensor histidine kinase n=1 Tax=Mucilaginibacter sp. UYCu711 TaxID=3156339 RepID=UPI003D1C399C
MSLFESYLFNNDKDDLAAIINSASAGIWEFDVHTKKVTWSTGFYKVLGYEPGEIECSYNNFINSLLYHEDRKAFLTALYHTPSVDVENIFIRLLTKKGFQWFQSSTNLHNESKLTGTIVNVHNFKLTELQVKAKNEHITEANKLIKLGCWEFDVDTNVLHFNNEALDIFELNQQVGTIENFTNFFIPEHQLKLSEATGLCINFGKPYELDLKIITARKNSLWVKIKALANIDNFGKCLKVSGVIQDITSNKQNEHQLKSSLTQVNLQNKRLQNFAYIVSHNLRSYVGNLAFMINLHEETSERKEKAETFNHIKTISNSLNTMVSHLNEIVKVESDGKTEKTLISLELLFNTIVNALQSNIKSADAIINFDFSKCPYVYYLPAYLESIFFNLLTNALKYRDPSRQVVIKCESFKDDENIYVTFEDNGLGIDLSLNGDKIFGMYQTFHRNADAQGIGLYITRNQVEALGGSITVESTVNIGTKFIVKLC